MAFYEYRQNNSFGSFVFDHKRGISIAVIVEADDALSANRKAEGIGLYFDGYGDCSCCGDRWYGKYDDDHGDDVPSSHGEPIKGSRSLTAKGKNYAYIHYADGRVVGIKEREK
jgi:hypothetical protein